MNTDGAPGAIRTHGLPLRRGTLYPAELRGHCGNELYQLINKWGDGDLEGERTAVERLTFHSAKTNKAPEGALLCH